MNTHHLSLLRRYDGPISCPPWCSSTEAEHLADLNNPRLECAEHLLEQTLTLPSGSALPVRMSQGIDVDKAGVLSTDDVTVFLPGYPDEMSVADAVAFGALLADFANLSTPTNSTDQDG